MCRSEKDDSSFQEILHAENVSRVLDRQWNRKKCYVMKWKL